jgi:hypothetical protein
MAYGLTAGQMANEFDIQYDLITNIGAHGFYNNAERSFFLSKAQENIIKQRYHPAGNKYGEGFEETEKRRKDLSELTENVLLLAATSTTGAGVTGAMEAFTGSYNLPNGNFWKLPANFMWSLSEGTDITLLSTNEAYNYTGSPYQRTNVKVLPKTHDEYQADVENPFAKPYYKLVWRMDYSRQDTDSMIDVDNQKRHELITDGTYDVDKYRLRYVRRPDDIIPYDTLGSDTTTSTAASCKLDPSLHREIVAEAVRIAVSVTRPELEEVKELEVQKSEQQRKNFK